MQSSSTFSRRSFLVTSLGAGGFLLVGCGSDGDSTGTDAAAGTADDIDDGAQSAEDSAQKWSFVDDRGEIVSLPTQPVTLVAFSTPTAALAEIGLTPAGVYAWSSLADDTQLRYTDLTDVETIGEIWGELNIEALTHLDPDVVIASYDPTDGTLAGITDEQRPLIEAVAPIIAIDNTAPLLTQFSRFQELGTALGADLSSADVLNAREEFNELSRQLEAAAAAKPGLKVMAVSASENGMNVAQPLPNSDLTYYGELGVDFVVPDGEGLFWWEELSSELIDKYDADVILVDSRSGDSDLVALEQLPLWSTLPAVEAGQVYQWHAYDPPTYRFYQDALRDLVAAIEASQPVGA